MTGHPDSNTNLAPDVKTELDRAESLGLFKDPSVRPGLLENLQLLAMHYEIVLGALSQEGEPT